MSIFMTKEEANNLETSKDIASDNKLIPTRGVGFIYGKPASRKTTIAIDTVKSIDDLSDKVYIDMDSKSKNQILETFTYLDDIGWKYHNALLKKGNILDMLKSILNDVQNDSCIIIDTWHQLLIDENDNKKAKQLMRLIREESNKKNLLVVLIAHTGKYSEDIRGASSVSGDVTFKVLISTTDMDNEYSCEITKDSLGLLSSTTAIMKENSSIVKSKIEYTSEIKEEKPKMKPREYALQVAMEGLIKDQLNEFNNRVPIADFRLLITDEVNNFNKVSPTNELFLTPNFIKLNFTSFCDSIFKVEKNGRQKYITGLKNGI